MERQLSDQEVEALAAYYMDPVAWWRDFLGPPYPFGPEWDGCREYQVEILNSIADTRTTNVVTGHGVGKDFTMGRVPLWWLCTRPNGIVLTTAAKDKQVEVILWGELRKAYKGSRVPIGGDLAPTAASLRFSEDHYALGMVAKDPNALQGFHAPGGVLVIVDEAAGVPPWALEAFESCASNDDSRIVKFGNPTCSHEHPFYKECRLPDVPGVRRTIHVSTLETPNYVHGSDIIPGLSGRAYVEDMRRKYGESSIIYATRVLGKFPPKSATGLISYADVEACRIRSRGFEVEHTAPRHLGVDVARYGEDDTIATIAQGGHAFRPHGGTIHGASGPDVARRVAELIEEWDCVSVAIDVGGVGVGVVDTLYDLQAQGDIPAAVEILPNDFGARATDPREHADRRTELWYGLRDWLRDHGAIEIDEGLEEELLAPSYKWAGTAVRLEPKDAIKKRIGRSPDRADSLALAVHGHVGRTSSAPRLSMW